MEYLSLQDIPHRQYDSLLHSRRMASLQSTERYAQVDERLRDAVSISHHRHLPLPVPSQAAQAPTQNAAGWWDLLSPVSPFHKASQDGRPMPPARTRSYSLDVGFQEEHSPLSGNLEKLFVSTERRISSFGEQDGDVTMTKGKSHHYRASHHYPRRETAEERALRRLMNLTTSQFIPKTTTQYQPNDFRRTPPIQPGESSSGTPKLPSFSEVCQ
tara:strand:+ start:38974 stop:39615 length:642 start_codon:yes stop_codon:yes gene_type:complete